MGFFSGIFKFFTQPVMPIIQAVNDVTASVTMTVDSVVGTVSKVVAPIPVVGTVVDNFVFRPVDAATDIVDSAVSYANRTVDNALGITGDALDLNIPSVIDSVGYQLDQTGDLAHVSLNGVGGALSDMFDFG